MQKAPESRIWLVYAFISCIAMCVFNYINGNYDRDLTGCMSGKVVNSIVLGLASAGFHFAKSCRNRKQEEEEHAKNEAEPFYWTPMITKR